MLILVAATVTHGQEREEWTIAALTNDITLVFSWQSQYRYAVSAGAGGAVEGTGNGFLNEGASVSNRAIPNQHYQFIDWSGVPDGLETQNPLVFALEGPRTGVTANFELRSYQVVLVSTNAWFGTNTIGNPQGAGLYPALSAVTTSVDRIVVDPENPDRRLIFKEVVAE